MYCIKIPKKDIWRHRNHIQNYFFLEFNPENMPAVANVGFKDLFTLSKLSTDSKSKLGSLMAHLQKLGCWSQLKSSLPSPQSFGQKETLHPQSHKYNSADTTFKNVASIISEIRCENRFAVCANKSFSW